MSMKILSPAGDMESLKAAIFAGADEVYLGVKDFNARNIEGFSLETLKEAVHFCHIFGVKANLTVNILFSDEEIQSALDLVVGAYNIGVDSFIVQDIGLMNLINKHYPEIEIHASTQMGLHNLEGVLALKDLGFSRVVLARETMLSEIERIKRNTNLEIEYFCHGALCVSFSGNCYLSSYLFDASGNRGKCKQLCRLPYAFYQDKKLVDNGYLLSAKDFNMLDRLNDLEQAGVDVLKIEGRARRPYYVSVATRTYKNALLGKSVDEDELKLAFNRGFVDGYFSGNGNIISKVQNHIGIEIGTVKKVNVGKKFNEIFIKTNKEIQQKSVLKFLKNNQEVVLTAFDVKKEKDMFKITSKNLVEVGANVFLIGNLDEEEQILKQKKKRQIFIEVFANENKPIKAVFELNGQTFEIFGSTCEVAKNMPIDESDISTSFAKSEWFDATIKCDIGHVFLTKKQINDFRRSVYEFIENELTLVKRNANKINVKPQKGNLEIEDWQLVEDKQEKLNKKTILYFPEEFDFEEIVSLKKDCEQQGKDFYLFLPNFATKEDVEILREGVEKYKIKIVVNNPYALNFNVDKIIGPGMNVFNSFSAKFFNLPYIRAEGGDFKMPYMTLRHCPIKQHLKSDCASCKYNKNCFYQMQNGKKFKLKRVKVSSCTFYLVDENK